MFANSINEERKWKGIDSNHHRLCVIIPFRDSEDEYSNGKGRWAQLAEFIPELTKWLEGHGVEHTFIVAEQDQGLLFNKGSMFNFGFAAGYDRCDYSVFHDVDHLPTHPSNNYHIPDGPKHLCRAYVESWGLELLGGAFVARNQHFIEAHGFSLRYWGWGQEDDDIYQRMIRLPYPLERLSLEEGKYRRIEHEHGSSTYTTVQNDRNKQRLGMMKSGQIDTRLDGIFNIRGEVLKVRKNEPELLHLVFHVEPNEALAL